MTNEKGGGGSQEEFYVSICGWNRYDWRDRFEHCWVILRTGWVGGSVVDGEGMWVAEPELMEKLRSAIV